jgi:hypothetical protein
MTIMNIWNNAFVHEKTQIHNLPNEPTANKRMTRSFPAGVHIVDTATYNKGQQRQRRRRLILEKMSILPDQLTSVFQDSWYTTTLVLPEIPYYVALIIPMILSMFAPVMLSLFAAICTFSVVFSPMVFVLFILYFAMCTSRPQLYYNSHSIRSRTIVEECESLRRR